MSVNEEIREQRKKLKGQGFKAHWDYFWEYYKIHTIIALAVIIFLVTLIRDIANNKPAALDAIFINCNGQDTQTFLQDGFTEYAGIDTQKEVVVVDTAANFISSTIDTTSVAASEKIMAMLSAKALDVLVADDTAFGHYAAQETFMDLRNVFSEKELSDMEEQIYYIDQSFIDYMMSSAYTDYLTSGKYDPDNKYARMAAEYNETFVFPVQDISDMERPVPVGIYLDGSKAIKESGSYTETVPIAGVVINTQKQENAKKFIEYLRQK